MKMKSRILVAALVVALAAAVIGGATLAWFTAEADVNEVEFTAGTVLVDASNGTAEPMEGHFIDNVNPGDCATVCWDIINKGTKSAEFRVKIDAGWMDLGFEEEKQVAFYAPVKDSDWVMYEEDDGLYLYYTGGPVAGTYDDNDPVVVPLCLVVGFDGPDMGDNYQGKSYAIGGEVEAVQATNGAPEDNWDGWAAANAEGYAGLVDNYFVTGRGASMSCWTGEEIVDPDPEPDPDPVLDKYNVSNWKVTITGCGYCGGSGAKITAKIEALDEDGNTFTDLNGPMTVLHGIKYKTHKYSTPATTSKNVDVTFTDGKADFSVTWAGTIYSITDAWIVLDGVEYHN